MTSVQVANAGQLRNVEVLETETGGNIAGVAEPKVMWVSCSPESKKEQPSHPNVFADGLSQMSRRRLEASDNYAAGCPGALNLADNLSSSIMKEVREVDKESECKICPNYWISHDPIDSLKANECNEFEISLNNALPSSGLCAALTRARARALGKNVDKKSAHETPMSKPSERAKRLQRRHENPGSHRHKTDGIEPEQIAIPVEVEEHDLFEGVQSPELGDLPLPPPGRIRQNENLLQEEDELLGAQVHSPPLLV
jgi:hypothetical protein